MPQKFTLKKLSVGKDLTIAKFQMPVDFKEFDNGDGWKLREKTQEDEKDENEQLESMTREQRKEKEKKLSRHKKEKLRKERMYQRRIWNEWYLESSAEEKKYHGVAQKFKGQYMLLNAVSGRNEFVIMDVRKTWIKFNPEVKPRTKLEEKVGKEDTMLEKRLKRYKFVQEGLRHDHEEKVSRRNRYLQDKEMDTLLGLELSDDEGMADGENLVQYKSKVEEKEIEEEFSKLGEIEVKEEDPKWGVSLPSVDDIDISVGAKRKAEVKQTTRKRRKIVTPEDKLRDDIIKYVWDTEIPIAEFKKKFIVLPNSTKKERKERYLQFSDTMKEVLKKVTIKGVSYVKLKDSVLKEAQMYEAMKQQKDF